ncbi:MAG: hypothetical protein R2712_19110 [Vicinamibacterales bacterium]
MVAATLADGAPGEVPHERNERGVEDGQRQREHREDEDREHRLRVRLAVGQVQRGQREPDREAAAVAHEDGRPREVEDEEPEDRPDEDRAGRGPLEVPRLVEEQQARHARNHGRAGRQAVHVVQQVQRVGDGHHPEHDDGQVDPPGERVVEVEVGGVQQQAARELQDDLGLRADVGRVIDQPDDEHQRGEQEQGCRERGERQVPDEAQGEAGEDADAPVEGGGLGVPAVGTGRGKPAALPRQPAHRPRGSGRDHEGLRGDEDESKGVRHVRVRRG